MHPKPKLRAPSRRRLIAAWFGIFSLTLPMLAPIAQGIPLSYPAADSQAQFYMVLCKAMQDGTGGPAPTPEQSPDMLDCPVCLGFSFGKTVFSTPACAEPAPTLRPLAFIIDAQDETRRGRPLSLAHARAPPQSA